MIHGMTGSEKANLACTALSKLSDIGMVVASVTCDGLSYNVAMSMSWVQNYILKTWSMSSHTRQILFDVCHIIKLIQNNFATLGVLLNHKRRESAGLTLKGFTNFKKQKA